MHYFFRVSHNGFTAQGQGRIKVVGFYAAPAKYERFVKMSRMCEGMLRKFVQGNWDAASYAVNTTNSIEEVIASIHGAANLDDLVQFVVL